VELVVSLGKWIVIYIMHNRFREREKKKIKCGLYRKMILEWNPDRTCEWEEVEGGGGERCNLSD
jgi:hypothetical protein